MLEKVPCEWEKKVLVDEVIRLGRYRLDVYPYDMWVPCVRVKANITTKI
jgi:hypothetical protein